ncbi:MAG: WYL domain-containing protein [Bacteroidota bacterium]
MTDARSILLDYLRGGQPITQREAVRRLGLTSRTARRHLGELEKADTVTVTRVGREKQYTLALAHRPLAQVPIELTEGEAEALTVAVLAAREVLAPTPFAGALALAHGKLERTWVSQAFSFEPETEPHHWSFDDLTEGGPTPFDRTCFVALVDAVRNRRPVRVDYFTASRNALSEDRLLHPLGFLMRAGSWMLAAFDPSAQAVKDFALAGFQAVRVLDDAVSLEPDGFDLTLHARDRFRALAGSEVHEVRVLVSPEALPYFRRKRYHGTQQIEEAPRADGHVVVSFEAEGLDSIAAWALSWGPKVRVLAPDVLVERVANAHKAAAAQYLSSTNESP